MIRSAPTLIAALSIVTVGGCHSKRGPDASPFVQDSARAAPVASVAFTVEGVFAPGCVELRPGDTVEWYTEAPELPANVTSLGEPLELYSPNLQPPLSCGSPGRTCWRHSFARAGCFEYFDSNSGSPGRAVRDPYYGTVKYVGQAGDVTRAVVCVDPSGRCPGVCCDTVFDCPQTGSYECISRRCVDSASKQPVSCTGFVPSG